ncbi:MAG: amino acid permease [Prolixibacteraceae bacterium]|jgi:solute carrier family 12 (sodium/potassium/chloride transporter), member 2|nr:amino acid permease [Prolixibacteraceae bacterium]MBT6765206.1 amino acid permease [Prolixibacteraceae bacterium]MBT6998651.1 amino acid permease [Prolixibacteraceae bacterium]MBT7397452.1 amino acid permease [Prolixibacteraceae bacterium]
MGKAKAVKKFGTFGGVFTPTLLTIMGVIMYLRLGWVVGNAGLLGAWLIIIISFLITLTTALSMSSITTNIKIGAGGAYAIISQSLGLEIGGSLGIPRYVSQGLAVTMYIFGFREGWLSIFPNHPAFIIDLVVFIIIYSISYKSADLAIRTQYIIMAIIISSLFVIVLAAYYGSMQNSTVDSLKWGTFPGSIENNFSGSDFWIVFAVFFPAATGIMAGANMSGELKDPRKSIPVGTLWAIGLSFLIYMGLAYWVARSATTEELLNNYNIMIDKSFFPPLVIAGVLGATFSSALASMVGSSRILYAMGKHQVLPASRWLGGTNKTGQPRNAMIVTGGLVFFTMLLRDLNAVAQLVTMFFLITYAMLNVVVIIEQNLGLISFRPLFKVPKWIPWVGLITSVFAMFIINATISLFSVAVVLLVYGILLQRKLTTPFEDVRSGLFVSFAEWAAKRTSQLAHRQERAWKPNLLIPVSNPESIKGVFSFLKNVAFPQGSIKLLGIGPKNRGNELADQVNELSKSFQQSNVFSSWAVIRTENFAEGVNFANQAYRGSFIKPNIVFLNMINRESYLEGFNEIINEAARLQIGVLIYSQHPNSGLGQRQMINVWIRNRAPDWKISWDIGNLDLSILVAYKLKRNWNAKIRLVTVVENEEQKEQARKFMADLMDQARLPKTEIAVYINNFNELIKKAPNADLNIFGLVPNPDFEFMEKMVDETQTTCLFIRDSGLENIFA